MKPKRGNAIRTGIAAAALIAYCSACGPGRQSFVTDRERDQLKGPVKSVTVRDGRREVSTFEYDRFGNHTWEIVYGADGEPDWNMAYHHDEFGIYMYGERIGKDGSATAVENANALKRRLPSKETEPPAPDEYYTYEHDRHGNWTARERWRRVDVLREVELVGKITRIIHYYGETAPAPDGTRLTKAIQLIQHATQSNEAQ